ncbi:DUF6339 family protein [Pseudomonas fluorescens]|uniref:Uncharacterized protein n=1 Tax=Pseudomonas fluorescens TaxID=294 RepID=A0A5E7FS57_PSEFL|nr:DUF6339 family protein [Pseudomonas fluorescens]VVO42159.1 hypothetical protein PS710_06001 [Pseudomonas fluorescens]
MTVHLFPRLNNLAVQRTLQELQNQITSTSAQSFINNLPGKSYGASGGSRINNQIIEDLCAEIIEIAEQNGYPDRGTKKTRAKFDSDVSIALAEYKDLNSGELQRDDIWSYISTAMLPTVVIWRFRLILNEELTPAILARFRGGVRNTFQRLWVRSDVFDRGDGHTARWELLKMLPEDAMVQVTERASIVAMKNVALAIAEGWLDASNKKINATIDSEKLMREAIILIRLHGEIIDLSTKKDSDLKKFITRKFSLAASMIKSNKKE